MCPTMVTCSERQRLRGLLVEAINVLCKTSLKYKSGFSIEGLLGITVDNNQVFLVNIQADVKNKSWDDADVKVGQGWALDGEKPTPSLVGGHHAGDGVENNGPMDLRTNHHNRERSVINSRRDHVTNYACHTGMTSSYKVEGRDDAEPSASFSHHGSLGRSGDQCRQDQLSLSPSSEDGDDYAIKMEDEEQEVEVTAPTARRNGVRSTGRNNGEYASTVMKPQRSQLEPMGHTAFSPFRQVKREKGSPLFGRRGYPRKKSNYSSFKLDQNDDDVILIKDEQDSEGSSEDGSTPMAAKLPTPRQLPPEQSRRRKAGRRMSTVPILISPTTESQEMEEEVTPESCARTLTASSPASDRLVIDDPMYVKIEDDGSSPGGTGDSEASPTQVIYEAGTWAKGDDVARLAHQPSKRRAGKPNASQIISENTLPNSAADCQSIQTPTPRKRSKKAKGARSDRTSKQPVAVEVASAVVVVTRGNEAIVQDTDVAAEEQEGRQAVAQCETDLTEWPADLPRRPRTSYSTAYKLMVVRKALESGNMRATARRFGIHFKQVWQWTRNKEKLLAMSLSALRSPRLWPQDEAPPAAILRRVAGTGTITAATATAAGAKAASAGDTETAAGTT